MLYNPWDVHMASPYAPGGLTGLRRLLTLQLTLGITLLSILFYTPVILGLPFIAVILWWVNIPLDISLTYSLTFLFSISVGCFIGISGALRTRKPDLIPSAITMPIYWLFLFGPALRAFTELKNNRFHWHKTRHGVSRPVELKTRLEPEFFYVPFRRSAD
jgi:hypothetical protein